MVNSYADERKFASARQVQPAYARGRRIAVRHDERVHPNWLIIIPVATLLVGIAVGGTLSAALLRLARG